MPDVTIHARGIVLETVGTILYRVELPNSKKILAHLSKPLTEAGAKFSDNQAVIVELTPYDFDLARILGAAD